MTPQSVQRFLVTPSFQLGVFIAIVTGVFFGLGPPLSKAIYADGANFVFVSIVTMFCRGFFLTLHCLYHKLELFASRKTLKITATGAFFHSLGMATYFGALALLPGPVAAILLYTFPLMLLAFLVWRGEARLTVVTVAIVLMALLGLSFVLHVWDVQADIHWGGVALALFAGVCVAMRMYFHGKQLESRSPYIVGAENFILAVGFTALLAFWKMPELPHSWVGYAYTGALGVAFGLGSWWAFTGMAMTGSFTWSLLGKIEPVYAAIFSALFFHDYLTRDQYIGMAILFASLVLYQFSSRPQTVVMPKDAKGQ